LSPGDSVKARFFSSHNERHHEAITLPINSTEEGERNVWSYALANKTNQTYPKLRAGTRDSNGVIEPAYGDNPVYAKEGSQIIRMEIEPIFNQPDISESALNVTGV